MATFLIEIAVPPLFFAPIRRLRLTAFYAQVGRRERGLHRWPASLAGDKPWEWSSDTGAVGKALQAEGCVTQIKATCSLCENVSLRVSRAQEDQPTLELIADLPCRYYCKS